MNLDYAIAFECSEGFARGGSPDDVRTVSRNARGTKAASFLVFL